MLHDGFRIQNSWFDFLPGADRVGLDLHSYLAFTVHDNVMNNDALAVQLLKPCSFWGTLNDTLTNFGVAIAGEWSLAINDCGLCVRTRASELTHSAFSTTSETASATMAHSISALSRRETASSGPMQIAGRGSYASNSS